MNEWQERENSRMQNTALAMETEVASLRRQNAELKGSLAEMVEIYWGAGDGIHPPPMCIQRAKAAFTEGQRT